MIGNGAIRAAGRRRLSGVSAFTAEAVDFDGTNDSMAVNGSGWTDSKFVTYSFWARWNDFDVGGSDMYLIGGGSSLHSLLFRTGVAGQIQMLAKTASNTTILNAGTAVFLSLNTWHHILVSMDLSDTGKRYLYIDDVSRSVTWTTYTNGNVDWSDTTFTVCNLPGYSRQFDGDLSELYINNAEYIDLSTEANRRDFITSDGKPVDLGSDGSTPTGTQPLIYMKGAASVWNAGTNAGDGGNFTMTGSVADSSNEPVELP